MRRRRRRFSWLIVVQVVRELARASEVLGCLPQPVGRSRAASREREICQWTMREWRRRHRRQALGALPFAPPTLHVAHARTQSQIAPYTAQALSCVLIWAYFDWCYIWSLLLKSHNKIWGWDAFMVTLKLEKFVLLSLRLFVRVLLARDPGKEGAFWRFKREFTLLAHCSLNVEYK